MIVATRAPQTRGLRPNRSWEVQPAGEDRIHWTVDSRDGIIQGPLDCQFLRGKTMLLQLGPQQIALLTREGSLDAVLLEGHHHLTVGNADGCVPAETELLFLAADRPLHLRWQEDSAIWVGSCGEQKQKFMLQGRCTCAVNGPARFFAAFLRHSSTAGAPFTMRVVDALIRARVEQSVNAHFADQAPTSADVRAYLDQLSAADLRRALRDFGLECEELSVHALPQATEPALETSGQSVLNGVYRG